MARRAYSDETLMAYADGELPPDLMAEIDAVVADDDAVAERVAVFAETRHLAGSLPPAPVPDALRRSVEEMVRRASSPAVPTIRPPEAANSNTPWHWRRVAAAAAIAIVAGGIGYGSARFGQDDGAAIEIARSPSPEIGAYLSSLPSGGRVELAKPRGEFEVVATFPVGDATCREFEILPSGGQSTIGIACRSEESWITTFAMTRGGGEGDFTPASGVEAVEAYLASIAAGPVLDEEAEIALLKKIGAH